jgi:hypothetical protein
MPAVITLLHLLQKKGIPGFVGRERELEDLVTFLNKTPASPLVSTRYAALQVYIYTSTSSTPDAHIPQQAPCLPAGGYRECRSWRWWLELELLVGVGSC